MRPRPATEQFSPHAHAYDVRGCKGNPSSRHAATGKNIIALFTPTATLSTTYTYTPFGKVTVAGEVEQPLQWSSEYHDPELALIYYNYRYYNPTDGRWTRRDPIRIVGGINWYRYCVNIPSKNIDNLGLNVWVENTSDAYWFHQRVCVSIWQLMPGNDPCCGATITIKKYCISFAPAEGRGSSSASDSSSRGSSSTSSESDSSATPQGPHSSASYDTPYSDIEFESGVLPPGMNADGTSEFKNGEVYVDTDKSGWGIEEDDMIHTTCQQDQQVHAYLASLVGLQAHYAVTSQNCRAFSWSVLNEIKRRIDSNK